VERGEARFWLDSDRAGDHAVDVRLHAPTECSIEQLVEVASDAPGWRRYETTVGVGHEHVRRYVSSGGCVTYRFDARVDDEALAELDLALSFQPRSELVAAVDQRSGLLLCGAEAADCVGADSG
jgi:hypothetical protein